MPIKIEKAEEEYNQLRIFVGVNYPKGKCRNILQLFTSLNELLDLWLEWNAKKMHSHDFCMVFEKYFRPSIRQKIQDKMDLKSKVLRQMVREA